MGSTSTPSFLLRILFPFHGNYFLTTGLPLRAVVTDSPTQTKAKKQVSARGQVLRPDGSDLAAIYATRKRPRHFVVVGETPRPGSIREEEEVCDPRNRFGYCSSGLRSPS